MRYSLAIVLSLFVALASSGCIFIDGGGVEDVSISADIRSSGIELVVYNDNPYPVRIRWADSSYVYQDGYSSWLTVLEVGGTDYYGVPYDETVPAYSSLSTWVAPSDSIDPYTGSVWIPMGPPGAQVRIIVSVEAMGDVAALDYAYRF